MEKLKAIPAAENKECLPVEILRMYQLPGTDLDQTRYWYHKYQDSADYLRSQPLQEILKTSVLKKLDNEDWDVRMQVIEAAVGIDDPELQEKVCSAIEQALEDESWYVRKQAIEAAMGIDDPELQEKVRSVVEQALENKSWYARKQAIEAVTSVDDEEWKKVVLDKALGDKRWGIRKQAIEAAVGIDDPELQEKVCSAIEQALEDENWGIRRQAAEIAVKIDNSELHEKVNEVYHAHFREIPLGSDHILYDKNKTLEQSGFADRLDKTGSETVLLDTIPGIPEGTLHNKMIARVVDMTHFLAWQRAFESHEQWQKAGFDYVPVEPIISFTLLPDATVRVFCPVLDNTVHKLGLETDPLLEKTLEEIDIKHGHLHANNVCTYFGRDKNGHRIINQPPRQYIIDFDQAQLQPSKSPNP